MKYAIKIPGKTKKQVTKINLSGKNLSEFPENIFEYTAVPLKSADFKIID